MSQTLGPSRRVRLGFLVALLCSPAACSGRGEAPPDSPVERDTDIDTDIDTDLGVVIAVEGRWSLAPAAVISDDCGVGDYQDVTSFVPEVLQISDSSEERFGLGDGTVCERSGLDFVCDAQDVSEEALGGAAVLEIQSTMHGTLQTAVAMDLAMDVVISACEGAGCGLIELVLNWPCPIELRSTAALD